MGDNCLLEGQIGQEDFGAVEPEDDLDAFNDETFGNDGIGDAWQEDAHEQLAQMTEQERIALKQSSEFFDFGSDGEELGGELEDALEPPPKQNGGSHGMAERLDQLSLQSGSLPPPPLSVQTNPPQMVPIQQGYPQPGPPMPGMYMQPQQMVPHPQHPQHPQFPLLPPSHFAPPNTHFQDPAIMSLSKMPPPPQFLPQTYNHPQALPPHFQPPPPRPNAFSPPTVPGMKSMADLEAEMMYGSRPPGPPPAMLPPPVTPTPVLNERSGQLGHINPAIHNLSYPGMRDRHNHPIQPQSQPQQQQQQQQQQPPPSQFRNSPVVLNQVQPANQGFQQQQQQHQQPPPPRNNNNNNMMNKPSPIGRNQMEGGMGGQFHQGNDRRNDQYGDRRNDQFQDRRNDHYRNDRRPDQFNDRRNDQFFDRRNDHYDNRRNDRDNLHHNRHYDNRNSYNEETFGPSARTYQDNHSDQATRRDLMPGHVHTLGILRHSRSRHDRDNAETFGEEGDGDALLINPTGDPLLDAKMLEEQEELAKRRKHYASNEDEYAGLMSQRDKQWIINIQLNQLKCDNPYVDDYYYTMYQHKREAENNDESKAGGQLLLNESMDHSSYTPTQFENSLGKLQVVTVKAPRQIIDVGVVRSADSPVSHMKHEPVVHEGSPAPGAVVVEQGHKKQGSDYKQVLIQIEVLYMALLDLESDQLKLSALPTGAPLREQVSSDELSHQHTLQSGLSSPDWLADCLAVPKGRSLVLRSLSHLTPSRRTVLLTILLGNLHLLARGDKEDTKFWGVLAQHIALESRDSLEFGAKALLSLKRKTMMSLLTTSLGSSLILTMVLKASLTNGGENLNIWSQLASVLLSCVAEGGNLGEFMVKFTLTEATLDRLITLDGNQKPAWFKIMALSSDVEKSS